MPNGIPCRGYYSIIIIYNYRMVRAKTRYITVELICPTIASDKALTLKNGALYEAIRQKIQLIHGDYGTGATRKGFLAKYCNENTRIAILRARHGPHEFVLSCLPFITKIDELDVSVHTLHVGATLKQSYQFIVKYQRAYLDSMYTSLKSEEERIFLRQSVMNFTRTDVNINIEKMT